MPIRVGRGKARGAYIHGPLRAAAAAFGHRARAVSPPHLKLSGSQSGREYQHLHLRCPAPRLYAHAAGLIGRASGVFNGIAQWRAPAPWMQSDSDVTAARLSQFHPWVCSLPHRLEISARILFVSRRQAAPSTTSDRHAPLHRSRARAWGITRDRFPPPRCRGGLMLGGRRRVDHCILSPLEIHAGFLITFKIVCANCSRSRRRRAGGRREGRCSAHQSRHRDRRARQRRRCRVR